MVVTYILIIALTGACVALYLAYRKNAELREKCRTADIEYAKQSERVNSAEAELSRLREEAEQLDKVREQCRTVDVERARLAERLEIVENEYAKRQAESEERFRLLAADVLNGSSKQLSEQHALSLKGVIAPLKEEFDNFRKAFNERYDTEARERFSLSDRIRQLVDLNNTIGQETRRLTDALKGNSKMQGDWGEMILENILSQSTLVRGREYFVQQSVTSAEGRVLRPDVVLNLSNNRHIVIDSKVSIQHYLEMTESDDAERTAALGKAHVASVKKHIQELAGKNYQDYIKGETLECVMMFVPHEGAYMAAMKLDPTLWETAYRSRVLIITPTHLLSVVKLVEQMWSQERSSDNAKQIAEQAGLMLDKFRGFLEDMDKLDKCINSTRDTWNSAFNKLSSGKGNLISRATNLREMGVKMNKELPDRFKEIKED